MNFSKLTLTKACCAIMTCSILFASSTICYATEQVNGAFLLPEIDIPEKASALDKKIIAAMQESQIVGLSTAVIKGDKVVWLKSYGWADLRTDKLDTPDTIFRAASISKMFTATALMQLYEQGKFQLDDDISKFLGFSVRNPNFPEQKITFRQLLTHTSSIVDRDYNRLVETSPALLPQVSLKELLAPGGKWYSGTFGSYIPGSKFSYSNLGSGIVGSLVEKISGERFDQYCINHIFKPLGLDASFDPADIKKFQNMGVLYRPTNYLGTYFQPTKDDFNGKRPGHLTITAPLGNALGWSPAGSLRISVRDLSKFIIAHINGGSYNGVRLLKPDTVDLMHQMHWFGLDPEKFYEQKGLNFQITDDLVAGRHLTGHAAEAYGLIGDAFFDKEKKVGVILLMNGGSYGKSAPFYKAENTIATALLQEFAGQTGSKKDIKGNLGKTTLSVNNRKIVLPVPSAQRGKLVFIPAISTADALATAISQDNSKVLLSLNNKKLTLTVGSKDITVNNKIITLSEAPYQEKDHIMVPIAEVAKHLDIQANIKFNK